MEELSILAVIAIAVAAALIAVFLRDSRLPVLALLVTLSAGAVIVLRLLPVFGSLWSGLSQLSSGLGVEERYLQLLLKIIALAYISEFGAQLCRDAGQGAIALKVEIAAKLCLIVLALPIFGAVTASVLSLLS